MNSEENTDNTPCIRAAQYIRMSTEHQQYSTENQSDMIQEYAEARGYEIVRTSVDGGGAMTSIGGEYEVASTIGQSHAGVLTGNDYGITGGFWYEIPAGDCTEDGYVDYLAAINTLWESSSFSWRPAACPIRQKPQWVICSST